MGGGDFNCSLTNIDADGGNFKVKYRTVSMLESFSEEYELVDIWRLRHPDEKCYTWRTFNPIVQRRLDYFLVSDSLQPYISLCNIVSTIFSDHSAVMLKVNSTEDISKGPAYWHFNTSLLEDNEFISQLTELIPLWKNQYMESNGDDSVGLWELLKYKIRCFSISFSKTKCKSTKQRIKMLESKVSEMEKSLKASDSSEHVKQLLDYKSELNTYYKHITKGIIIRSKTQWYEDGEKSTKYFLNLQKKNKVKSCIRKLSINGRDVSMSKDILIEIKKYFADKYQCESNKTAIECEEFLQNVNVPTLSEEDQESCKGSIRLQ